VRKPVAQQVSKAIDAAIDGRKEVIHGHLVI
jgi:hypothetical protein